MKRDEPDSNFETLLEYLKRVRGFDFTGYKRPSLMRRVQKRMQEVGIQAFDDYRDYLEVKVVPGTAVFVPRGGVETARNVGQQPYREVIVELKD